MRARAKQFKLTLHAHARQEFGLALAHHFLRTYAHVEGVEVKLTQPVWERAAVDGVSHNHAFVRGGPESRFACVTRKRADAAATVTSGLRDLHILKTSQSAFTGFNTCRFTTLPPTDDRLMGSEVEASWQVSGRAPGKGPQV